MEKFYRNQLFNANMGPGVSSSRPIELEQLKAPGPVISKSKSFANYSSPLETKSFNEENVIPSHSGKSLASDSFDFNNNTLHLKETDNNFSTFNKRYQNPVEHRDLSKKITRPPGSEGFHTFNKDLNYSAYNPPILNNTNFSINYPVSSNFAQNAEYYQKSNPGATFNEARRNSFTCSSSSSSPSSPSPPKQTNSAYPSACHDPQFFQFYSKEVLGQSENEIPKIDEELSLGSRYSLIVDSQSSNSNQFAQSRALGNSADIDLGLSQNNKRPKSTFPFGKCKVCNDKATGVHYGIATCEGCKVCSRFI